MQKIETVLNTMYDTYQVLNMCWKEGRKGVKEKEWKEANIKQLGR